MKTLPILLALAAAIPSVARAANQPASLPVVWRISLAEPASQVLVTPDRTTAIVSSGKGVRAYAVSDGHLLWQTSALQEPMALSGDRLIGNGPSGQIVAVDAKTARKLWSTAPRSTESLVAADVGMVFISPSTSESETRLIALNAATGAKLWDSAADEGIGESIDVLPNSIVLSYAAGEPHFSYVEIHDRRNGKTLGQFQTVFHANSFFEGTLWLSESLMTWDGDRNSPAVEFSRYDATTAAQLSDYVYKPGPTVPTDTSIPTSLRWSRSY